MAVGWNVAWRAWVRGVAVVVLAGLTSGCFDRGTLVVSTSTGIHAFGLP